VFHALDGSAYSTRFCDFSKEKTTVAGTRRTRAVSQHHGKSSLSSVRGSIFHLSHNSVGVKNSS
jgi:hypothetical protein